MCDTRCSCPTAVKPEPPTSLAITNIQADSVLLQLNPGFSGYTSISKWIVEGQVSSARDGDQSCRTDVHELFPRLSQSFIT